MMEKETCCINSRAILDYIEAHGIDYADIIKDLDPEIDDLEDPAGFLRDPDNWISSGVVTKLFERATQLLDDDQAAYKMGRYVTENTNLGFIQRIMVKAFWSIKQGLRHCQQINDQWNKSKKVELKELKRNEATVRLHWTPGMKTSKYICQYNQGVYTYLPLIWGGSRLTFKERCCYFDGAPYCEYHLKWPLRNRFMEIITRFYTSKSVLMDTIKQIERDKRIISQKNEELRSVNEELQKSIAEHRQTEDALRESEEKYRNILQNIDDGYFEVDIAGNLTFSNDSMCKILGYPKDELMGMNNRGYMDEENFKKSYQTFNNVYQTGIPTKALDWKLIRKDGSECFVETVVSLIKDSKGNGIGFRGIARDITDRKQLESQLQQAMKMESIGTLAGGIAHDFNNLLMGIQGRTSLALMNKKPSHPDFKHLKEIEACVTSAADLTKQLLGFGRGGKYEVKPTDLNETIRKSSRMFGRTKKEIKIHRKHQKDVWTVETDQGQIEQVLMNLYVNAWQAMPGGGDLYIQTENVTVDDNYVKPFEVNPGRYVKISVTDTGIGMDEATRQRIFEPFFTTKEMGRGTGLGLASAYGIIKNHGGFINVYSEKGEGTTFTIYLPLSDREVRPAPPTDERLVKGSETILLVDDEEMILEVGRAMLEKLGYRILVAVGGEQAVDVVKRKGHEIGLVILDLIMPGMNGGKVFDRIKEIRPQLAVMLSSGYAINGQAEEIMQRGCNGFVQKPFNLSELSRKVREILEMAK